MECQVEKNKEYCPCSYYHCSKKGICCECIRYHRENNEIPACFFSKKAEKTYDRSIENFIKDWQENQRK